jgi:hypothetical protein
MSDAYYQERAARRSRTLLIAGALVAVLVCVAAGVGSLLYDACTRSFDRSPQAVISAYVEAVSRGDAEAAQECWEHETFYDLEAGCSEVCLSKALGAGYSLSGVDLGPPQATADSRSQIQAVVDLTCAQSGEPHTAELVLDSVGGNVPWKHWSIVRSTLGGTFAEPWCR